MHGPRSADEGADERADHLCESELPHPLDPHQSLWLSMKSLVAPDAASLSERSSWARRSWSASLSSLTLSSVSGSGASGSVMVGGSSGHLDIGQFLSGMCFAELLDNAARSQPRGSGSGVIAGGFVQRERDARLKVVIGVWIDQRAVTAVGLPANADLSAHRAVARTSAVKPVQTVRGHVVAGHLRVRRSRAVGGLHEV